MTTHSRQHSFASSFVSTSANSTSTNNILSSKKRTTVKIGPWKLGKTLGKGATGRVFLATNVITNQKAAVKIVSKAALANDSTNDDDNNNNPNDEQDCDSAGLSYGIEREIIIMKLLNHKNVLRLYDVWETEKALYLVLEYVEGGELFDLLVDSGPLPEKTAVEFFSQIILGASYCHNLGICHRDLKPENILLDKDLNVKIADFGMAALESGRLLETSCGSPHYAAPEIISGLHYHGAESDVWSCGVILFALLTGRLPFDDDNIRDLLLKVQVGKYQIDEDLSDEAINLIHQMLTVDPAQRIKTKDILKHPLIKKYYNCENDQVFNQLPSPECANNPVKSKDEIDQRILENLVILWHGRSSDSIVQALVSPTPNPEKTFYSLLLRYRHDHAMANKGNNNKSNDQLIRSSSIISKTTDPLSHSSPASSSNSNNKKRLSITASNSSNRPISFSNKKNTKSKDFSVTNLVLPNSSSSSPESILKHKRNSQMVNNNPMLIQSNGINNDISYKRQSLIAIDTTPTKRKSRIPSDSLDMDKIPSNLMPNSKSNSKSKLKRNSVTSKVLSTYAKMAEYEKTKKSVDDYGKRTSSDFAALCDVLFGDESKLDTKIPKSDSMATINAIVFGNNKRQSFKIPQAHKRSSKVKPATVSKIKSYINETNNFKNRNSSNPTEKIVQLLNKNEIKDFERRTASDIHTKAFDLVEPPKPISRLDPRYKAYETYQKRSSQHAAYLLQLQEQAEIEAKAAAEIKEREDKIKREQEALECLKNNHFTRKESEAIDNDFNDLIGLSSGTVLKKNIEIDHSKLNKPRASKLKSNRYSALSMYSTKASSKRLSFYLKELDEEIEKNKETTKKDRLSRLSMLITEPDFIKEDEGTMELNFSTAHDSMNTLKEDSEEDTADTGVEIHNDTHSIGKPRSASVSNALENDLCFVSEPIVHASQVNNKPRVQSQDYSNITKASSVYNDVPQISSNLGEITTVEKSELIEKIPKLPKVPGSPIKKEVKKVASHNTFEIFEDAVRKSKQEFEEVASKITATSHHETPPQNPIKVENKPLVVEKQRKALSSKNTNIQNVDPTVTQHKASFFTKFSQQLQPATERKSSLGKTFKSLFGNSQLAAPETLNTVLTSEDTFEALKTLLSGWRHYGIGNLVIDSSHKTLRGEILKSNTMNVKSCKFSCVTTSGNISESKMIFNHEKGSAKSFARLVGEIRRILSNEDVLVR
jgi:serine/threonine-protein kinase GIN4